MSAFVVHTAHIDVLLRYALEANPQSFSERFTWRAAIGGPAEWTQLTTSRTIHTPPDHTTADEAGRMLMEENVASVCARYEQDTAEIYPDALTYTYTDPGFTPSAPAILKAIACLDYQSCEHAEWESSQARRFLDALEAKARYELMTDSDPWDWTPELVKAHRAAGAVR